MLTKNQLGQHPEYFDRYISLLPDTDVFELLDQQPQVLYGMVNNLSEEEAGQAYAPGKWTLKELLGHMIDTDRIFAYRCLCISRHETQSLPGFDENAYVQHANFNSRTLAGLLEEYDLARKSHLALFRAMNEEMLNRTGMANNQPVTAKAFIVIMAGHELHHLNIIKERYMRALLPA
jgi:uncharacterized damage-inducible protein DinB